MENKLKADLDEHVALFQKVRNELLSQIVAIGRLMRETLNNGKKIMAAGNGGSAADAQHFCAELIGRYLQERDALAAIALTTDTSILTAVGNDYGYDHVFSRQVDGLGCSGDILLGISTSGKSPNLVRAFESAKRKGVITIALVGKSGGPMMEMADHTVLVPSNHTPRIQEAQQWIWHSWCDLIDQMA